MPCDPRVYDPGTERVAQVHGDVRHPALVGELTGKPHRARRTARSGRIALDVTPQLDRYPYGPFAREQCGDGAVDAARHRDNDPAFVARKLRALCDRGTERPVEGVCCQLCCVELARGEPA